MTTALLSDSRVDERVVYIRSFAKAIAPDLRLAVAAARPWLRGLLTEAKSFADGWSPLLSQRALAHALSDDEMGETLAAARSSYQARRSAIIGAMEAQLASLRGRVTGADGVNVWVHLPSAVDAAEVIERAAAAGVLVAPGEPFFIRPRRSDVLRVSIGTLKTVDEAATVGRTVATAVLAATVTSGGTITTSV